MIGVTSRGSFSKTFSFLDKLHSGRIFSSLDRAGQRGVDALSRATPVDTAQASKSWRYEINRGRGSYSINWINDNVEDGVNVAVLIQYGHGTGTGGYVQGRDYINPAMRPVFDKIASDVWREVTNG